MGLPMIGRLCAVALVALVLSGCASQQTRPGFYWGNYEQSLYSLADNPGDRASGQHLNNLRQVIRISDSRGMLPPPGAMLELAVLEANAGNQQAYLALVNREYQLYPESRQFIARWFNDVLITPIPTDDASDIDEHTDERIEEDVNDGVEEDAEPTLNNNLEASPHD